MVKRFVLYFGALGYLMAVLRYTPDSFSVPGNVFHFLWYACFGCPTDRTMPLQRRFFWHRDAMAQLVISTGSAFY
jgi:hypothetical protein